MKSKIWIIPTFCLYLLLISASTTQVEKQAVAAQSELVATAPAISEIHTTARLSFFQRIMLKYAIKHYKADDVDKADRQARTSLTLGLAGLGLLIIGLFVPYVIFLSVPAAVMAMVLGGNALRGNTTEVGKAKNGKGFGLGTLIAFGVVMIAALILVASLFSL